MNKKYYFITGILLFIGISSIVSAQGVGMIDDGIYLLFGLEVDCNSIYGGTDSNFCIDTVGSGGGDIYVNESGDVMTGDLNFSTASVRDADWINATNMNATEYYGSGQYLTGISSPWDSNATHIWNSTATAIGIGTGQPTNLLDIQGGVAIRSGIYAGSPAPTNGLFVEGDVSIGGVGGIGELDIYEPTPNAQATIRLSNAESGSGAGDGILIFLGIAADMKADFWLYENGYMRFGTNNQERVRILSGGDVEIYENLNMTEGNITDTYIRLENTTSQPFGCGVTTEGFMFYNSSSYFPMFCNSTMWVYTDGTETK